MSLEISLQQNNELLTELISVNRHLLAALQGSGMNNAAPTSEDPVRFDIEILTREAVVTLAVLYPDIPAGQLDFSHAAHLDDPMPATVQSGQSEALYHALQSSDQVAKLHNNGLHELCLLMLANWDAIPDITGRREFAEILLNTPHDKRDKVKPEGIKKIVKKSDKPLTSGSDSTQVTPLFEKARSLILELAKIDRAECVRVLELFSAKKLGEVDPDRLPELIAAAEQALESEHA